MKLPYQTTMRARHLLPLVLLLAAGASGQDLGETAFANSGAPEAQAPFLRGLLLLHSFEYDDARDAFREAEAADPTFAMAYWGEAMTHSHPVWMQQDREAALEALGRLAPTPEARAALAPTDRERAYLATADVLFGAAPDASGDKDARDDAYALAMADLAARFPDDLDARAFYALSILGTAHEGRDFTTYMKAAAVAEEVFDANPRHPGAAHYLIHAYDDPVHAPLGLRPARVYADIAPAASHALHMPSHIYLALGMWDEVAALNERSYDAARAASDRRGEALNGHGWHALWWWHYAATQLGDEPLAERLLALAQQSHDAAPTASSASHVTRILAQHATAFEAWDVIHDAPPASGGLTTQAIDLHARGLSALARGDDEAASGALETLEMQIDEAPDPEDVPWAVRAAALQLAAALHGASGDAGTALDLLRRAAALEAEAPLMFGPPSPVVPAHEALGYALLASGDAAGAAEAFEVALSRQPNRRQSVEGLTHARDRMRRM